MDDSPDDSESPRGGLEAELGQADWLEEPVALGWVPAQDDSAALEQAQDGSAPQEQERGDWARADSPDAQVVRVAAVRWLEDGQSMVSLSWPEAQLLRPGVRLPADAEEFSSRPPAVRRLPLAAL
jgi:hypothetical protein